MKIERPTNPGRGRTSLGRRAGAIDASGLQNYRKRCMISTGVTNDAGWISIACVIRHTGSSAEMNR